MPRIKVLHEFSHPLDDTGRRRVFPAGWEGHVEDDEIDHAKAVQEGNAAYVGSPAAPGAVMTPEIPADWQELNAADMIALAHKLGAGGGLSTKAAAEDFIGRLAV